MDGVIVPFQASIDYSGFRILATAKLGVDRVEFNDAGDVKRVRKEFVLGTADRGLTVVNQNRFLDTKMAEISKSLNLGRHFVKGENDLNSREVFSSVDLRGFKGRGNEYYLVNFWRGYPSENPDHTPHLLPAPRGNSIFYRLLRPEFVKSHPVALSANANTQVTAEASDWIKQLEDNEGATRRLVGEVIPKFCEGLARKVRRGGMGWEGTGAAVVSRFHALSKHQLTHLL